MYKHGADKAVVNGESFACASKNNDIYLFNFATQTCIGQFYAHDDIITSLNYSKEKLVSTSKD